MMRGRRKPELDRAGVCEASGLFSLAAQECECEVQALDLAAPALRDGALASGEQVLFQLVELVDVPTPSGSTPRQIGAPATATLLPILSITEAPSR